MPRFIDLFRCLRKRQSNAEKDRKLSARGTKTKKEVDSKIVYIDTSGNKTVVTKK